MVEKKWYKICPHEIMRAEKNISNYLGISQRNLAMMLRVGLSQLSMYELGRRPLSLAATQQLAEMVAVYDQGSPETFAKSFRDAEIEGSTKVIQKQLDENLYQQYKLLRAIETAEQKYNKRVSTLNFLQKLSLKQGKNESGEPTLPELLAGQTARQLEKENWTQIRQNQIKLEVLKCEEKLLREELGEKEE